MNLPTVFHVTHWKAASQWVAEILKYSAPERYLSYEQHGNLQSTPLVPGGVYGTVYLPRQELMATVNGSLFSPQIVINRRAFYPRALMNWWNFVVLKKRYKSFVVIRDLRDTLISLYFSIKHSHIMMDQGDLQLREALTNKDLESGLLSMIINVKTDTGLIFAKCAQIQQSWLGRPDVLYLRYEDMLGHEHEFLERLIDYCKIGISREKLYRIVDHNLFNALTGRQRGQEDIQAHLRKGVAGDWRNYFNQEVKDEFRKHLGETLIRAGYEKDLNW